MAIFKEFMHCVHTISHLFQFAGEMSNLTFINSLKITYIPIISYMPTLPIYVAVYRIFKSSTAYRFYMFFPTDLKKKNVKKFIVNCSYVDYSCRFPRRINVYKSKLFRPFP